MAFPSCELKMYSVLHEDHYFWKLDGKICILKFTGNDFRYSTKIVIIILALLIPLTSTLHWQLVIILNIQSVFDISDVESICLICTELPYLQQTEINKTWND